MFLKLNYLKFLFYTFPLFMIFPSGYLNAYILIFIIYSLFFFYLNKIRINLVTLDYLIILFFLTSVISTLLNLNQIENFNIGGKKFNLEVSAFTKSIFNLRFFLLYIIVRNVLDKQLINIKVLSILSLTCCVFLSFGIFLQHLVGFDFFGNSPFAGRYNSFFEHEAIAGSYLQKFFLISIFFFFLLKKENLKNFFAIPIFINIFGLGILLSLDRMPYIIFFFSILILLLFLKKYRIKLFISIILTALTFQFFFNNYDIVKNRYQSLTKELELAKISKLFSNYSSKFLQSLTNSHKNIIKTNITDDNLNKTHDNLKGDYLRIYNAAYQVFLKSPLLGTGLKSFLNECKKLQVSNIKNITCAIHPHNIYLEILINQGIIGFLLFLLFLLILIKKNFIKIIFSKITVEKKILTIFFFTILICELIPVRSYGSIFQTFNGSIFWFSIAILSSRIHIKK